MLFAINPHRQRHAVRAGREDGVLDGAGIEYNEAPARRRHVERLPLANLAPQRAAVAIDHPVVVQIQNSGQRAAAVVAQPQPLQQAQLGDVKRAPVEVPVVALAARRVPRELALAGHPMMRRGLSGKSTGESCETFVKTSTPSSSRRR